MIKRVGGKKIKKKNGKRGRSQIKFGMTSFLMTACMSKIPEPCGPPILGDDRLIDVRFTPDLQRQKEKMLIDNPPTRLRRTSPTRGAEDDAHDNGTPSPALRASSPSRGEVDKGTTAAGCLRGEVEKAESAKHLKGQGKQRNNDEGKEIIIGFLAFFYYTIGTILSVFGTIYWVYSTLLGN